MRLVSAVIQEHQTLAVQPVRHQPLPPATTLLDTCGKLTEIIGLTAGRRPRSTTTAKTRDIARIRQDHVIQRRQNASDNGTRTVQLFNRQTLTCSNERLQTPCLVPKRFDQHVAHGSSTAETSRSQVAESLGVSSRTVKRWWPVAGFPVSGLRTNTDAPGGCLGTFLPSSRSAD